MAEARLEAGPSGLVPTGEGWFVVNAAEAAWLEHDAFGHRCVFEGAPQALGDSGLDGLRFADLGCTLTVLEPGTPSSLYHAESVDENFLVLAGECLAVVDGEERSLRAWDFLHCPRGTAHCFVGAGDGPCVVLLIGPRTPGRTVRYPVEEKALAHGAGVREATDSPREAYASVGLWRPGRLPDEADLPWR